MYPSSESTTAVNVGESKEPIELGRSHCLSVVDVGIEVNGSRGLVFEVRHITVTGFNIRFKAPHRRLTCVPKGLLTGSATMNASRCTLLHRLGSHSKHPSNSLVRFLLRPSPGRIPDQCPPPIFTPRGPRVHQPVSFASLYASLVEH